MRDDLVAVGSGKGSAQSGGPLIWKPSGRGSGGAGNEHVFLVPQLGDCGGNEDKRRSHRLLAAARVTKWSKTSQKRIELFKQRSAKVIHDIVWAHLLVRLQRAWELWLLLRDEKRRLAAEEAERAKLYRSREAHRMTAILSLMMKRDAGAKLLAWRLWQALLRDARERSLRD